MRLRVEFFHPDETGGGAWMVLQQVERPHVEPLIAHIIEAVRFGYMLAGRYRISDYAGMVEPCCFDVHQAADRSVKVFWSAHTGSFYPPGWPTCPGCGRPALDGHITCGDVACDEGGRR